MPLDAPAHALERARIGRVARLSLLLCGALILLEALNSYVYYRLQGLGHRWLFAVRVNAPWWVIWMALCPLVVWLAERWPVAEARWRRRLALHLVAGFAIAAVHVSLGAVAYFYLKDPTEWPNTVAAQIRVFQNRYLFSDVITYAVIVAITQALGLHARYQEKAMREAALAAEAARLQLGLADARLQALRAELNPHFLFNALNAISGLVRKGENETAVEMLARLGGLLRTTLSREMPQEIALEEELDLERRFLALEQLRFGDRLRVDWRLDPGARLAMVPTLILQPLLENALRYGVSQRRGPASIAILTRRSGASLELCVDDSGRGWGEQAAQGVRRGVGLSNTRERLEALYGDRATMELTSTETGGARVSIRLPFREASAAEPSARPILTLVGRDARPA